MSRVPTNVRQAMTQFGYAVPELLGAPNRPFPRQLARTRSMAIATKFIEQHYPEMNRSALRRYLDGEFTDGQRPYNIPNLQASSVEVLLLALDTIETMANEVDAAISRKFAEVIETLGDGETVDVPEVPPVEPMPKRRAVGRGVGSKSLRDSTMPTTRKKRGRPKGSRNQPKIVEPPVAPEPVLVGET